MVPLPSFLWLDRHLSPTPLLPLQSKPVWLTLLGYPVGTHPQARLHRSTCLGPESPRPPFVTTHLINGKSLRPVLLFDPEMLIKNWVNNLTELKREIFKDLGLGHGKPLLRLLLFPNATTNRFIILCRTVKKEFLRLEIFSGGILHHPLRPSAHTQTRGVVPYREPEVLSKKEKNLR